MRRHRSDHVIEIGRPPADVFAFLADPTTAHEIDPAVESYRPIGGAMGLGVKNQIVIRAWGRRVESMSVTTRWEPPLAMAFRSVEPSWPVIVVAEHTFVATALGTRYLWSIECKPVGRIGYFAAPLVLAWFKRNASAQQRNVKAAVESRVEHGRDIGQITEEHP